MKKKILKSFFFFLNGYVPNCFFFCEEETTRGVSSLDGNMESVFHTDRTTTRRHMSCVYGLS